MKKITFLLLLSFINLTACSQNPNYRYHELQDLGTTIEWAISIECTHHFQPLRVLDVNLKQNFKLEVGKIYKVDLGLSGNYGTRYYKVTYAGDTGVDKGDELDAPPNFGSPITDLCNSLSWKYIRPILLGSTVQEAQSNYCTNLTANTTREKVNIKITQSLAVGSVYFMDFGKGPNYYLIDGSSPENGDADYEFDPTLNNAVFSPATLNCPKPDLQANAVDCGNATIAPGTTFKAVYSLKNIGGRAFSPSHCLIYFSKGNATLSADDILIKDITLDPLNPNEIKYGTPSITIPANISGGIYYAIMQLVNSEETNTGNNIVSSTSSFIINQTTTPTGKPDLAIDPTNTIIFSNCFDCSAALSDLGSKRHTINNQSGIMNLQVITVKNIGSAASTPSTLQFYLSSDGVLDSADIKSTAGAVSIGAINPGASISVSRSIFSSDFGGLTVTGNRNILISVDDSKTNAEANENNNVTPIPVTFVNPFARTAQANSDTEEVTQSYTINVYNFDGQKVLTKEVNSKEQEDRSLDNLKTGIYIIKSKGETRKVLKK